MSDHKTRMPNSPCRRAARLKGRSPQKDRSPLTTTQAAPSTMSASRVRCDKAALSSRCEAQGPPMTLANMGQNGMRMIWTKCPVVRELSLILGIRSPLENVPSASTARPVVVAAPGKVTCVSVRSAATGPRKVELLASAFGGQMRHASRDMYQPSRLKAKERLAFGSKSSMCMPSAGSRLAGGLPCAPIAARSGARVSEAPGLSGLR